MTTLLGPICEALHNNRGNVETQKKLLLQYIEGFDTDLISLTHLAHDPQFQVFLQYIFDALVRTQFPAPNDSDIPPIQLQCLEFLTTCCLNHPDLLSTIASLAPLDDLILVFFTNQFSIKKNDVQNEFHINSNNISLDNNESDDDDEKLTYDIENPQMSHLLPAFKFLAAISCSSAITLTSTKSLNLLIHMLHLSMVSISMLSVYSVSCIASFSRNCTTFTSFLKSMPTFSTMKKQLASFLSSNDHSLVIVSLSAISMLFNRGIDKETALKVSIAAVNSPSEYQFITTIAASIILQLSDEIDISQKDAEILLKAAMGSKGMSAYVIFKLLIEVGEAFHQKIRSILQNNSNFFNNFLKAILDSEEGFVTVAGAHLLLVLFETNPISPEFDISESFTKALKTILSGKIDDIDKLESLLLIVRLLISVRDSMPPIVKLLQENEENIFISFQRQIELSNSFVSIHFFLFILSASHFFKHWITRLREMVVDSQFSALLVHVLQTSLNRRTIDDALEVLQIVIGGISPKRIKLDPTLSYTVASGFFLMNRQKKQESLKKDQMIIQMQKNFTNDIEAYDVEKECREKEMMKMRQNIEQYESRSTDSAQKLSDLEMKNEALNRKLQKKKDKLIKIIEELKLSESKLNDLSILAVQHENDANTSIQKSEKLKAKVETLKRIQVEKQEAEKTNEHLRQRIKELQMDNEGCQKELENMIAVATKEKNSRKELEKLLSEAQMRINQLSTSIEHEKQQNRTVEKSLEKLEIEIKDKGDNEVKLTQSISQMRDEMDLMKERIRTLESNNEKLKTLSDNRCRKISELRKERKELATLTQLIHKITDGNFENVESLVVMPPNE